MEPKVVFVPDPFLEEGPTAVHDMIRAARTQPLPALQATAGVADPARRFVMAQRQPQPQHGLAPMSQLQPAHPLAPLPRHVQEALDEFDDDLAFTEEATRDAGETLSRTYEGNDQITQLTLEFTHRRKEATGFADAEEELAWRQRRGQFIADMGNIYDVASFAMRQRLLATLANAPERPPQGRRR